MERPGLLSIGNFTAEFKARARPILPVFPCCLCIFPGVFTLLI